MTDATRSESVASDVSLNVELRECTVAQLHVLKGLLLSAMREHEPSKKLRETRVHNYNLVLREITLRDRGQKRADWWTRVNRFLAEKRERKEAERGAQ